jgi:hypothetical protein
MQLKTKIINEAVASITAAGYEPTVGIGSKHVIKWMQNGRPRMLVCSVSPSKQGALRHSRAVLRRLLNGSN